MLSPDQLNLALNTASLAVLSLIMMALHRVADNCFRDQRVPVRCTPAREDPGDSDGPSASNEGGRDDETPEKVT